MFDLLKKILVPAEIIALICSLAGFALKRVDFLTIGMFGLAAIFFLNAFLPPAIAQTTERKGFLELLATTICYKIAWIGSAVIMVGSLYRVLGFPGALEMLLIGCFATFTGAVVMGLYALTRSEVGLRPALYRAVPACLLGIYLFLNKPA